MRLKRFDSLSQTLLVLFKFSDSLFGLFGLLFGTLDQDVDILHDFVLGGFRLNVESLFVRDQVVLGHLLL